MWGYNLNIWGLQDYAEILITFIFFIFYHIIVIIFFTFRILEIIVGQTATDRLTDITLMLLQRGLAQPSLALTFSHLIIFQDFRFILNFYIIFPCV